MGPAHDRRVLELECTLLQHVQQCDNTGANDRRSLNQLQRLRRVDHVGRCQAVVQPARVLGRVDVFGDRGREGDHVVPDLGFDLVDAFDGEVAAVANSVGGRLRYEAGGGQRLRCGGFDSQPAAILILIGPDAAHLFAGVAGDHRGPELERRFECRTCAAWCRLAQRVQLQRLPYLPREVGSEAGEIHEVAFHAQRATFPVTRR